MVVIRSQKVLLPDVLPPDAEPHGGEQDCVFSAACCWLCWLFCCVF
jgi:hypothetical protein